MKNKELKQLVLSNFNESIKDEEFASSVSLELINSRYKGISNLTINKNIDEAVIQVNSYKIKKQKLSSNELKLQTYQTVNHEIEHAKTMFLTQKEDFYSYEHFISLLEYLYYAKLFKIDFENISFNLLNAYSIKKQLNKNYDLSSAEINANLVSYNKAKNKFKDVLSEDKNDSLDKIISSLEFLNANTEVYYNQFGEPHNKFIFLMSNLPSYIRDNPRIYEKFKILGHLFNRDGSVKDIYDIYKNKNIDNEEFYQKLMLQYMTSINCDYTNYLMDESFKEYMKDTINNYINSTINYYNNINQGLVFVGKKQTLVDNLIIKKNNVKLLRDIANKYNLDLSCGTIIDSNNVYRKKLV